MRILIATPLYPPEIGGPATYSKLLENELPCHGIEVSVLPFLSVRRYPKIARHVLYFWKVAKYGKRADIIFALDPVSVGLPACLAAFVLRKKFIIKIVGDYAWEQWQTQNAKRKTQSSTGKFITPGAFQKQTFDFMTELRRKIERRVAKRAGKVIVPSEYLKKIVMMWGVSEENIAVIYNAFGAPHIQTSKEELRKELGLRGTVLVSAGRLVPWKGFDMLIELMPEIRKEIPDAKLYIVGSGPEREALQLLISNNQLSDDAILVGSLGHNELLKYLKAAHVFVLNTGYEGFSHLVLEAMSVGTPVVTTNVGGNPELVEDGKSGILVPYNDRSALKEAITRVLKSKSFASGLAERAQRRVEDFNRRKMIIKTVSLLQSL